MYRDIETNYTSAPFNDLLKLYETSFIDNYTLPALTDYQTGKTLTYGQFAEAIAKLHIFYQIAGVRPGDKIALLGKNTPTWVIIFIGTITYGATIVPILQDFNPKDATHIINHSNAVILFINNSIMANLNFDELTDLRCAISLDSNTILSEREPAFDDRHNQCPFDEILSHIDEHVAARYPDGFKRGDIYYESQPGDAIAVINYTSGTTGFSKGVMLSYDNLRGNVVFGIRTRLHYQGSRALSFLPLAHAYGCAFDMLMPLTVGTHITLLGAIPSPAILVKAMNEVKPSLIICVPLVLEKIYRKMIVPMITKKPIRWVLAVPMLDKAIYALIRSRLVEAFGGLFEEVIVGGAPLNPEVEEFLYRIKFPFTVGYGMTECAPLISYTPWRRFSPGSCGRTLRDIMQAKIDNADADGNGEIMVKGLNVMKGYYKNEDATEAVLTEDGWLHTGDMGSIGEDGRTIFIRGRYKTMILSANGQNIYPEEIEAKLNNMAYVSECLVVERDGRLIALVYPDRDEMRQNDILADQLPAMMETTRRELNSLVAPYEKIAAIELVENEFVKTPKRSIKRTLYK
jgi:long-chain acyl-CoA synthetase